MIFFKRFCVLFWFVCFFHCLIFHFGCYFDFIEKIKNNLTPIVQKCYEKKISDIHRALVLLP